MKRILAVFLILTLLFTASGCTSMLEKEYYQVSEYTAETENPGEDTGGSIKNYAGLLRAINRLVLNHETSGQLTFSGYAGNIGDDLASACWEVKSETALGAFSVDYMSYDVSRIVSYYEAKIYITYKRSKAQTDAIVSVSSPAYVRSFVEQAVSEGATYLLLSLSTMLIDEDTVKGYVYDIYDDNLLTVISLPEATVNIYPDTGSSKIFEITLNYGFSADALEAMRVELSQAADALLDTVTGDEPEKWLKSVCSALAGETLYDPDADMREAALGENNGLGDTAYGVLVDDMASSLGFAMALRLLCALGDIECQVVTGRLDKEAHSWNIVGLEGRYYHVDISQWTALGSDAVFLKGDADMWSGGYWWDTDAYPACEEGYYTYQTPGITDPIQGTGETAALETGAPEPAEAEEDGIKNT